MVCSVSSYAIVLNKVPFTFKLNVPLPPLKTLLVVTVKEPIPPEVLGNVNVPFLTVIALSLSVWSVLASVAFHVPPSSPVQVTSA